VPRFRWIVLPLAVVLTALGVASGASAAGADSASGVFAAPFECGGTVCQAFDAAFTAQSGPGGESPSGIVRQYGESNKGPGVRELTSGAVTCLRVAGARAVIGFAATSSLGLPPYGQLVVQDGGTTGPDLAADATIAFQPITTCPDPDDATLTAALKPIRYGSITVHDALTRPEARAACRAERTALGVAAFRARYGPGHPMKTCVARRQS
jgi:hypothetical protein